MQGLTERNTCVAGIDGIPVLTLLYSSVWALTMTTLAPTSLQSLPEPSPAPSDADRLQLALLQSRGNLALATERLGLSLTDVLKLLNDPDTSANISAAIRGQVTLAAYNALDEIAATLPAHIASLEPNEAYRAFSSLLQTVAALTTQPKTAPSTLIQQNNYFTPEDAEVARGKLLSFVAHIGNSDSVEVESTFVAFESTHQSDSVA